MKKICTVLVILLSPLVAFGQNPYYDAFALKKFPLAEVEGTVFILPETLEDSLALGAILEKYVPGAQDYEALAKAFSSNPFLSLPYEPAQSITSQVNIPGGNKINSGIQALGGLNVTNFADGLARFLVDRMKKELSAAFFEKFKEDMMKEEYSDLKVLFPETWKSLYTIDKDIYRHSLYLNALRQAFVKDMINQYVNLQNLLKQPKYKDYFNREKPELGSILYTSLYLINSLSSGTHPGDVLKNYDTSLINLCKPSGDCSLAYVDLNLSASIQLTKILSEAFRSGSAANYWVTGDSARLLLNDAITFKLFMGLIYQQTKDLKFYEGSLPKPFSSILKDVAPHIDSLNEYKNFIETLTDNFEEINQYLAELRDKEKAEIGYNDYYKLYSASLDLLDGIPDFVELPYVHFSPELESEIKQTAGAVLFVARSSGNLYLDARTKNYTGALVNTLSILDTLLGFNRSFETAAISEEIEEEEKELKKDIGKKEYKTAIKDLKKFEYEKSEAAISKDKIKTQLSTTLADSSLEDLVRIIALKRAKAISENKSEVRKKILKYGSFIAAVAEAQSSEDVQNAIEAVAMPAGSYSVKRRSKFDISLNGYIGVGYDMGNPFGLNQTGREIRDSHQMNWNFSAPVGVAFSWGRKPAEQEANWFGKYFCRESSMSLFVSVIDVGGIAQLRLQDTAALTREIKLMDIVSPGISLIYGFPRWPLSLSAGMVYKPALVFDNKSGALFDVPGMLRWNIALLVDIPIVNIYNRGR